MQLRMRICTTSRNRGSERSLSFLSLLLLQASTGWRREKNGKVSRTFSKTSWVKQVANICFSAQLHNFPCLRQGLIRNPVLPFLPVLRVQKTLPALFCKARRAGLLFSIQLCNYKLGKASRKVGATEALGTLRFLDNCSKKCC